MRALGHLPDSVQNPGYGKKLQHRHVQVRVVSSEQPGHARHNPLPALGHSADDAQNPGYRESLRQQHAQL